MKHLGSYQLLSVAALVFLAAGCGDDGTGPGNVAPSTTSLAATPDTVHPSGMSTIACVAYDLDGDSLSYVWGCEDGVLPGGGAAVVWKAPLAAGSYEITVAVDDGRGHSASDTTEIEVRAGTLLLRSKGGLMAVGMSGDSFVLYDGFDQVEVLGTRVFLGPANVVEIDHTGNVIGGPGTPVEVTRTIDFTMLPDGGVAFAENWTDTVFFVSPEGEFLDAVELPDASELNQGMSVVVVGNDLIISETGSGKIARIDLAAHQVSVLKDLSQLSGWLGGIAYLDGVYYLTQWESLHRFSETEDPAEIAHFPGGGILDVIVVGTSAFTVSRTEGEIYRVDLPTGEVEVFAEGFDNPYEIEYLPAGLAAP
jgi:hypothetical protein